MLPFQINLSREELFVGKNDQKRDPPVDDVNERMNVIWFTFLTLIQIAALISLDSDAKRMMTHKSLLREDFHLGKGIGNGQVDWALLRKRDKVILIAFGLLFGALPALARTTLSQPSSTQNQRPDYFIQNLARSIRVQIQAEDPEPSAIFRGYDGERLDAKLRRGVILRRKQQEQLLVIKEKLTNLLLCDRVLWESFVKKFTKYKDAPHLQKRKTYADYAEEPPDENIGDQWVRIGCQNIMIESGINRMVDFIATHRKMSQRFLVCYQRAVEKNSAEIEVLQDFCRPIFETATTIFDPKTEDDSDQHLETILDLPGLHAELEEIRLSWASLSSDLCDEISVPLASCFEQFASSMDEWYQVMMTKGGFIKRQSKRLFSLRLVKDRDDVDFESMSEWDKIVTQESCKLLSRKHGKDGVLNWKNLLQKAIQSTKTQAIKKWHECFFIPVEQFVQSPENQGKEIVPFVLEKRQQWERYLDKEGAGVFIRLEELTKSKLAPLRSKYSSEIE